MSTVSKAVVDTLGLSKQEIQQLKKAVSSGVKTKKQIIYLEPVGWVKLAKPNKINGLHNNAGLRYR